MRDFLQHEIAVFRGISRVGGFLGGFAEPPKRAIIARTPHFLGGFRRSSVRKSRKVQLLENGALTLSEADTALARLAAARVQLLTHPDMVRRAREFARRFHQHRIYDALYAALADLRGCEFWTADTAFYNAVSSSLPFVKHIRNYP